MSDPPDGEGFQVPIHLSPARYQRLRERFEAARRARDADAAPPRFDDVALEHLPAFEFQFLVDGYEVDRKTGALDAPAGLDAPVKTALEAPPADTAPEPGTQDASDATAAGAAAGVPITPAALRAAFEAVPTVDDPTPEQRQRARHVYPDAVVPDAGPVPDPDHERAVEVPVLVPPWALAMAASQLVEQRRQGRSVARHDVVDKLVNVVYADETWLTPDGRDAIEAVLAAVDEAVAAAGDQEARGPEGVDAE